MLMSAYLLILRTKNQFFICLLFYLHISIYSEENNHIYFILINPSQSQFIFLMFNRTNITSHQFRLFIQMKNYCNSVTKTFHKLIMNIIR